MDATQLGSVGAGAGALIAGVTFGIIKVNEYFKSKSDTQAPVDKITTPINGKVCSLHIGLSEDVAVIKNDVQWIRQKHEENQRQQQEENNFKALSDKLEMLIQLKQ